jgi:hypothetical protein
MKEKIWFSLKNNEKKTNLKVIFFLEKNEKK